MVPSIILSLVFFTFITSTTAAPPSLEPRAKLAKVLSACTKPNTVAFTFEISPTSYTEVLYFSTVLIQF